MSSDESPSIHVHEPVDDRVSPLLVQLLQVLLAFVLGQTIIQNRTLLIEIDDPDQWVGLLAMIVVVVLTVESWIDWHIDVARHPFLVGASHDRRRWAMARLWLDVAHVAGVAYLGLTLAHFVSAPDASPLRHLAGYVAVHVLMLASTLVRDVSYGRHAELVAVQIQTCIVVSLAYAVVVIVVSAAGPDAATTVVALLSMFLINVVHHARLRHVRQLA